MAYKIKHICSRCSGAFKNTRANYKIRGNYCKNCVGKRGAAKNIKIPKSNRNIMWMTEDEIMEEE